ncbi:MAG: DUF748 domain-containing protein [Flammeovirgaceae bacterium]|nr:DUF748 domain-containing protein [Flammeovirgaceae bacterium]
MKIKSLLWLLVPIIIALLVFLLPLTLENYLMDSINEKLQENKAISINHDELSIELYPLTISFKNLTINSLHSSEEQIPDTLPQISAQFPEIVISKISYWDYVFNKSISINEVSVAKGKIQIAKLEDILSIDSLVGNLSIELEHLSIPKNDFRNFTLQSHEIILSQIATKTADRFYKINIKELKTEGGEKINLFIKDFGLEPQYPRYKFSKKKGFQTDRSEVFIPQISFRQIHLHSILNSSFLQASSISIDSMDVKLFRDKNVPLNPERFVALPQQTMRELPFKFAIDSFSLVDGFVQYEELIQNGSSPGQVYFNRLNAVSTTLSNDPNHPSNGQLDIKASGNLMGKGKVTADFHFNIFREDNQFNFSGTIGEMDLPVINPMIENVALVHLESGKMNKMEFSVTSNEDISIGNLNFYFQNLHAALIPPNTNEKTSFFKKILFDLMETLIVPKENLAGKKFRKGTIKFKRDKQKSIVNYWWKSIFSGIKSTVGV